MEDNQPAFRPQVRRVAHAPGEDGPGGVALTSDKQVVISKLRQQNDRLKSELKMLTGKLEQFVEKSRQKKQKQAFGSVNNQEKDEQILAKEAELKQSQNKIQFYKKEIENMRRQLEGSYNIQKIIALEDEQKNKERILRQLQEESESLLKVQKEQEKALTALNKHGEYDGKINELGDELRTAKEHLRKLQFKHREDEKAMKAQHEQLVVLEDKCRKMRLLIKDKKRDVSKGRQEKTKAKNEQTYTKADLERLQGELKAAEHEKVSEEKRLKAQVGQQEGQVKALQAELNQLNAQVKERDQEYRLNELKIKELRRQLPAKVLKPIDSKARQGTPTRQSPALPPQAPKAVSGAASPKASDLPRAPDEDEAEEQKDARGPTENVNAATPDREDAVGHQLPPDSPQQQAESSVPTMGIADSVEQPKQEAASGASDGAKAGGKQSDGEDEYADDQAEMDAENQGQQ